MKRLFFAVMLALAIATANAQTPTFTVPLSSQNTIFSAVTTAQTSGCLSNQGENVWFSNYILSGGTPTAVQYRLEYSYNSDSATCTTGTWFAMSDDGIDLTQGEVIGLGAYPFVRANLVKCVGCGTPTVTSFFSASSSTNGALYGFYNPSQQVRKTLAVSQTIGAGISILGVPAPYGSAAGAIVFTVSNTVGVGSVSVTIHYGNQSNTVVFALPNPASGYSIVIPMPSLPATSVDVAIAGASTRTVTAYYYFYPPGQAFPPSIQPVPIWGTNGAANAGNFESVSATNASVSAILEIGGIGNARTKANLFSVSAHCSAGTAQLTVLDGGTTSSLGGGAGQLYSTTATQVGSTANFEKAWNPGLTSTPGNGMTITLSTCGAGNIGTLDVQGTVL